MRKMALKFLTDENISASLVDALRNGGYNVEDIKEEKLFGIDDKEVLKLAFKENRVVITHDKDFANLLRYKSLKHKGVILLRFQNQSPSNVIKLFIPMLKSLKESKVRNSLVIISDDYIKIS